MRDEVFLARTAAALDTQFERAHGVAEIAFAADRLRGASRLAHLYQKTPCRVLFPRQETGDPVTAVLLTTSGGLTGGDSVRVAVDVREGAAATVTTQAAEKIYRSLGSAAEIDVTLKVGEGAWLEWLPQETILFDRAHLVRRNNVDVAAGGRFLGVEIVVFGRTARGERFTSGKLHDAWRVRYDSKLVWADGLHLEGDVGRVFQCKAGFDGAVACVTMLYVAEGAATLLETARALLEGAVSRAGATVVNGILILRMFGPDARHLRRDVVRFCARFRALAAGLPSRLPRVWQT
ncbi:MAG TPA: urease accessory protein UreD [Alphaproteobacteria bacterium]|nr:urease accessory protein UreD [Alphaproteobacteria bacterium]